MVLSENFPVSGDYAAEKVARVSAALPAAGAYDTAPIVMLGSSFEKVTFFLKYKQGAAGGKVRMKIEVSPFSSGSVWYQLSAYSVGVITPGADLVSPLQAQLIEFDPVGANDEFVIFGPVSLESAVHRVRVAAAESGVVGTPGTCEILARFA